MQTLMKSNYFHEIFQAAVIDSFSTVLLVCKLTRYESYSSVCYVVCLCCSDRTMGII